MWYFSDIDWWGVPHLSEEGKSTEQTGECGKTVESPGASAAQAAELLCGRGGKLAGTKGEFIFKWGLINFF